MKVKYFTNVTKNDEVKILVNTKGYVNDELEVLTVLKNKLIEGLENLTLSDEARTEVIYFLNEALSLEGNGLIKGIDPIILKDFYNEGL